jgi:esterase/lipase superfamily enzyme
MALSDYRLYQAGAWRALDDQAFRSAEQPPKTTVFFVHGLAVSASNALSEGWQVYSALAQRAPADLPIRFVIYSWPSDIGRHPLRAARSRHHQADFEGPRLAGLLNQLSPQTPISLVGHSSGARVVAAALE